MISNGAVDRAVHGWIADECSRSTVKNSLAILTRVMEQAVRDGIIDRNPARITGWQREYQQAEDELDDPRSLALPGWVGWQPWKWCDDRRTPYQPRQKFVAWCGNNQAGILSRPPRGIP